MLPTILATLLAFALVFSAYGQRLQIFDNGQSENGVDIELSPDDCSLVVEKGLGYVILEKTQRLADFHVLPKVRTYIKKIYLRKRLFLQYIPFDF